MILLDDKVPLYVFSWMDSGPVYHYANCGRLVVLLTFLGAVGVAGMARMPGWALWFGLLGVAAFSGFPTELTGGLLVFTYTIWALTLAVTRQPRAIGPALGLVGLGISFLAGFPRTFIASVSTCRSNLRNLRTAVEMYGTDYQIPPSTLQRLTGHCNYLRTLPVCGAGAAYKLESSGRQFTVTCQSGLHPQIDRVEPYSGSVTTTNSNPERHVHRRQ